MTAHVRVCRLSAGQVERLQRAHIALALVDVVVQDGHDDPAVADILARAGVSRKTFYRLFDGKEDARREAAELLWLRALHQVRRAGAGDADPLARAHAGAVALSRLVTAHPRHARLVLADAAVTGLPDLLAVLDPASASAVPARGQTPPRSGEDSAVPPRGQTPPRSGEDSAVPPHLPRGQTPLRKCGDLLHNSDAGDRAVEAAILGEGGGPAGLLARAGYGTHVDGLGAQARRVLTVLAAQPGASGAQVQRALGHRHASQTSRLLHRLRRQGLVTVAGGPRRAGWSLTRAGRTAARKRIT